MKVQINGTDTKVTLSLTDANGTDWTQDFIGNWGAMSDGQFTFDHEAGIYRANEETVEWWSDIITKQQALDDRISSIKEEHGSEAVNDALEGIDYNDLEDQISHMNKALDYSFSEDKS